MTRCRFYHVSIAVSLFILIVPAIMEGPFVPAVDGLDTVSGNIYIDGDTALASSPYVRGGSGTSNSPYMISDYDMGQYQMRIDNTISVVFIKNISFRASSSTALYFSNSRNMLIDNITCTGRASFLYSTGCRDITLSKANVSNVQSGTNLIDVRNPTRFTIKDSNLTRSSAGTTPIVSFNDQGTNKVITNTRFDNVPVDLQGSGGTARVDNCTFKDSRLTIRGADSGTRIVANKFHHSSGVGLYVYTSYRARIADNVFRVSSSGIYFYQMGYQSSTTFGTIENNTFESCSYGINTENNYNLCRLSKYEVKNNYFGNCSNAAIDLNWGQDNKIWHNVFYHNKGTLDSGSASQCEQTVWGSNNNQWTVNGKGNYWANHRSPDSNNDGFVDVNYTIPNNGLDTRPYTNPYFDSERPSLTLLEPLSASPERSYTVVRWSVSDAVSGIRKVEFSSDSSPFKDVTGASGTSVWLGKGNHLLKLKATDRAGLYTLLQKDLTIKDTYQDLFIEYPLDGSYVGSAEIDLIWRMKSFLEPVNQSVELDGKLTYEDPALRSKSVQVTEGSHLALVRVRDQYGLELKRSVNFTVDITDPVIDLSSPKPGSTLSLDVITFAFNVVDNIALDRTEVSLDGGPWVPVQQPDRHKVSAQEGEHSLEMVATDKAGNSDRVTVPFRIGVPLDLDIISPVNGTVTSDTSVPLEWIYKGPFEYTSAYLRVGKTGLFKTTLPSGKAVIPLEEEGPTLITVRLEDDHLNYLERSVTVIRDVTAPMVAFTAPSNGQYLSWTNVTLGWTAFDESSDGGLAFSISVDGGPFIEVGHELSYGIDLNEGAHKATIRAVDLANNTGEDSISFFVDRTPPTVSFIEPRNGTFIKEFQVDVRWDASDNMLLRNLTLLLDDVEYAEVADRTYLPLPVGANGKHSLKLVATDGGGLISTSATTFYLDTQPPLLEWRGVQPGIIRSVTIGLAWSVEEKVGLAELKLVAGARTVQFPLNATDAIVTLEEGIYEVFYLSATDLAGMETRLFAPSTVIIDLTPPSLFIDMARSQAKGRRADIYWLSEDNLSGLSSTYLSLDGLVDTTVTTGNLYAFENIAPGAHTITIMVRDRAGNEAEGTWNFTISSHEDNGDEQRDDGPGLNTFLIIALVLAVVVVLIIFLVLRSKRRKAGDQLKGPVSRAPGKLTLSIPAPVAHQGLPVSGAGTLPSAHAAAQKRTESTGDGTGYIRPSRPKKEKRRQKETGPDKEMDVLDDRSPDVPIEPAQIPVPPEPATTTTAADMSQLQDAGEAPVWGDGGLSVHPGPEGLTVGIEDLEGDVQAHEGTEEVEELEELGELDEVEEADEEEIEEWSN